MAKSRDVDPQRWQDLLKPIAHLAVGATQPYPGLWPNGFQELGINPRGNPVRNQYLGLVGTRPDENTFVFGTNYFDANDNCDNEDMYRFDLKSFPIKPYMQGTFEKEYPQYAGHHRAAKPYLRKPPSVSTS